MAQGWISLNRELMNHWVWDCEFSAGQAWVDLLLYANHAPTKIMLKGQLLNINRGQQARSELTLSKTWKWSRNKVRRFLKNLEKDGMVKLESGHLTTVITICNYNSFQCSDTASDTAEEQQKKQQKDSGRDTNNNGNNENNENNNSEDSVSAKPKPSKYKFNDDQMKFAKAVYGKVKEVTPQMKEPNLDSWANTARLMVESDKFVLLDVWNVFCWANSDNFWRTNILSVSKLREKYPELKAKSQGAPAKQEAPRPSRQEFKI